MDQLFSRKLFPSSIPAGLLAYSTFDNLPAPTTIGTVVYEGSKAAGAYSSGDCSGLSDLEVSESPDSHFNRISIQRYEPLLNQYVKK